MSTANNQESSPPPSEEQLTYLWDLYKYRHSHCWKTIYQIVAVVIALDVLPYAKPELTNQLRYWMLAPAVIATLFATFGVFIVNNELKLFAQVKIAFNYLQDSFLSSILAAPDVREMLSAA